MPNQAESSIKKLADIIKDLNYKAEIMDDRVLTSMGGLKVSVIYSDEGEVQLNCLFFKEGEKTYSLEKLNQFNSEFRFIKAFLMSGGELVLTLDHYFSVSDENAMAKVEAYISQFEMFLLELRYRDIFEVTV